MAVVSVFEKCLRVFRLFAVLAFAFSVSPGWAQEFEIVGEPDFEVLSVGQVPPTVMASAKAAAPSVVFDGAQRYWEDDELVYRVSGRLFREVWHVYVTQQGRLLNTEKYVVND